MLQILKKTAVKDLLMGVPRGVYYHSHKMFSLGMKPVVLEFKITSKCNSRCLMCNIWKSDHKDELSMDEFDTLFSSPTLSAVRKVIISGGEPFLRTDLTRIIERMSSKLTTLQEVAIFTNGFQSKTIVRQVRQILKILGGNVRLRIAISFDGAGSNHDRIRNVEGAHAAATRTAGELKTIWDDRVDLQANVAIGPYNLEQLEVISRHLRGIVDKVSWFPVIVSERNFQNQDRAESLLFDSASEKKLAGFFRYLIRMEPAGPGSYYYSRLVNYYDTGTRNFPCTGGFRFMHIDSIGNVGPCHFVPIELSFGNVRREPLDVIWWRRESRMIRTRLRKSSMCDQCTACADLYSVVSEEAFDFFAYLLTHPSTVLKMWRRYLM